MFFRFYSYFVFLFFKQFKKKDLSEQVIMEFRCLTYEQNLERYLSFSGVRLDSLKNFMKRFSGVNHNNMLVTRKITSHFFIKREMVKERTRDYFVKVKLEAGLVCR